MRIIRPPRIIGRRSLLLGAIIFLGVYAVISQRQTIIASGSILRQVAILPLALAILLTATTFVVASATVHFLAPQKLKFKRTILVSVANMFTNRLLPAGAGSIAMFYAYLRANKYSAVQASSVIAVNNLLGFVSHISLLLILLLLTLASFDGFTPPRLPIKLIGLVGILLLFGLGWLAIRHDVMMRVKDVLKQFRQNITYYNLHPLRIVGGYFSSIVLTICNAGVLWLCASSVSVQISPIAALAVFSIGIVASTVTPTPGGLGGIEAGLLAGLIAYHVPAQSALAAVLLFRLVSYWLTLAVGAATYVYVSKRGYLRFTN